MTTKQGHIHLIRLPSSEDHKIFFLRTSIDHFEKEKKKNNTMTVGIMTKYREMI